MSGSTSAGYDDVRIPLPSYSDLMSALEGTTEAALRLMGAVRGLFDSAGRADGYDEAVAELQAAYNAALDWFKSEAATYEAVSQEANAPVTTIAKPDRLA